MSRPTGMGSSRRRPGCSASSEATTSRVRDVADVGPCAEPGRRHERDTLMPAGSRTHARRARAPAGRGRRGPGRGPARTVSNDLSKYERSATRARTIRDGDPRSAGGAGSRMFLKPVPAAGSSAAVEGRPTCGRSAGGINRRRREHRSHPATARTRARRTRRTQTPRDRRAACRTARVRRGSAVRRHRARAR